MPDCRTVVSCACHFYPFLWIREISALLSVEHYLQISMTRILMYTTVYMQSNGITKSAAVNVFRALYVQKWIWILLYANKIASDAFGSKTSKTMFCKCVAFCSYELPCSGVSTIVHPLSSYLGCCIGYKNQSHCIAYTQVYTQCAQFHWQGLGKGGGRRV